MARLDTSISTATFCFRSRTSLLALALLLVVCLQEIEAKRIRWHAPLLPGRAQLRKPRDAQQRRMFLLLTGYANGRPGFIVDHAIALKRGGVDAWWNMQWQTISEAKAKDRFE